MYIVYRRSVSHECACANYKWSYFQLLDVKSHFFVLLLWSFFKHYESNPAFETLACENLSDDRIIDGHFCHTYASKTTRIFYG